MYLKVEQDGREVLFYRLDQSEVLIGSASSSHIAIQNNSISKKHLKLVKDGSHWYAIDQGSTNGTFLDEKQLIPGKRNELTSFSLLRLGSEVVLSFEQKATNAQPLNLVTTIEAQPDAKKASVEDKTQVISLEEFQKAKQLASEKRKKEAIRKRKAELKKKRQERKRLFIITIISSSMIFVGFIANRWWQKQLSFRQDKDTLVNKMKTKLQGDDEIELDIKGFRINRSALLSRNLISKNLMNKKCLDFEELGFCKNNIFDHNLNGVLKLNSSNFLFFLDEKEVIKNFSIIFPDYQNLDSSALRKAAILFNFQKIFSEESVPEASNLYIVLYSAPEDGKMEISAVGAMNSSSASLILSQLKENDLFQSPEALPTRLVELDLYFTVY